MNKAGKILSLNPPRAIEGGEITIECEGFHLHPGREHGVLIDGQACRLIGVSEHRIVAVVPKNIDSERSELRLFTGGKQSEAAEIIVGKKLADEMHIVANPAVDPADDSIILTRSGSRGQHLENTLYRLESDGYVDELPVSILNPTGIAFDGAGDMYVTNRADGVVVRIDRGEEAVQYVQDLGVATGIAFDRNGIMYVGDRSGTLYRVPESGIAIPFAVLEPSVSAFHMAFGPDGRLFVTAPGLASFDAIYAVDMEGRAIRFMRGFGRPQGLAFDTEGNLYVVACRKSRHGIVRISPNGDIETFVTGNNLVGLCFTRKGELIAATNEAVYSLPLGITGTLLA